MRDWPQILQSQSIYPSLYVSGSRATEEEKLLKIDTDVVTRNRRHVKMIGSHT